MHLSRRKIQPSPIESLRKMIPEESLWPINDIWRYHMGRNEFNKFDRWLPAFNKRYGEEDNVEDFAFKAQMSNYEAVRAMFEAFAVNKHNATGVIQWMLNSAMPGMLWQLYDWFLMPNGAFYGTKASCYNYNLVYNYGNGNVYLTNESLFPLE
ncbi:glycoside hydrolase family 2, partial [Bacteroidota bacterium]